MVFVLPPHRTTPEFLDLLAWDSPDGIHYRLEQTDPEHFKKVEDYLFRGDWEPRIVQESWSVPRLSKIILNTQTRQDWIEDCGFVWATAKKLRLAPLKRLVLDKLKLLAPYTHLSILVLARAVYGQIDLTDELDMRMRELVVDYISQNYRAMGRDFQQKSNLHTVMADYIDLSVAVADRLEEIGEHDSSEDEDEEDEDEDDDCNNHNELGNQDSGETLTGNHIGANESGEIYASDQDFGENQFEEELEDLGY